MSLSLWLVYAILQFIGKCCSGLVITECQNGKATAGEGTTVTLMCGKYSVDIQWVYEDDKGSVIGQCNKTTCTTHHNHPFSLQAHETWSNQYESVLSITNISGEQIFHLKCRSKDLDETAKCQLHVVKPPQFNLASCKVWLSNWRVVGECSVERMPASGVDYNCYWSVNNKKNFGGFKDKSYYTLHSVNYTRGVCSFNRSMNFEATAYTYSMHVAGFKDHFTKTITVEHPGEATHNCPTMVREGSSVSCRCNSSKEGNPPANTVWDGVMNETLHIENIQRQDTTKVYTCRLVWGSEGQINRSTLYTFDVAWPEKSLPNGLSIIKIIAPCIVLLISSIIITVAAAIVYRRKDKASRESMRTADSSPDRVKHKPRLDIQDSGGAVRKSTNMVYDKTTYSQSG